MFEAITYQDMLRKIMKNSAEAGNDVVGILITRPELESGKNIVNQLGYYHHASGYSMNFFLPGYSAYDGKAYSDSRKVTEIAGVRWYYSDAMFVGFIRELEQYTRWKYSGESELILVSTENGVVCYNEMLVFYLDKMLRDKVIHSIPTFFNQLFMICDNHKSIEGVSGALVRSSALKVTGKNILKKIPEFLQDIFKCEKYYIIKDYSKR